MEPRLVTRWEAARWAREAYTIGARSRKNPLKSTIGARSPKNPLKSTIGDFLNIIFQFNPTIIQMQNV